MIFFSFCEPLVAVFPAHSHQKKRELFVDTLDNAFDVNRFPIDVNGFFGIPFVITELALGSFGRGLGLIFLAKRQPLIEPPHGVKVIPVLPDVTGVGGFTQQITVAVALSSVPDVGEKRIRYLIFAG